MTSTAASNSSSQTIVDSDPALASTVYGKDLVQCLENLPPFNNTPLAFTQPPNPEWKFGMRVDETEEGKKWVEGEKQGWERVDAGEDFKKVYQLMLSGIQPRPIAFVSSVSEDGVENLAPFSFFNAVTPYPPLISYAANRVGGARFKDSAENVKATKEFTVNIISVPWAEQANFASVDPPADISEWELTGLTKLESTYVKAPRVKESAFSMECELFQALEIIHPKTQEHTGTVIYGLIKCIHVRKDVLVDNQALVQSGKLRTIARMGDIAYGYVSEPFRLPRSNWAKDGEVVKSVVENYRKERGLGEKEELHKDGEKSTI
ncbi:hypothetical protein K435DRAFT_644183 [Dendrothele bispora CBS 962.96]|uniref:Flavin reductase like domain-containing protein n=1 Tax=Dendrothele bispora (strain CBS 962.96) TaxID=1314807 RepID=A0A4S8MVJ4_DENBC|nr:hypothetical protein K435DRAFT_644183 [Dendrothele bispora CBS 962.96]